MANTEKEKAIELALQAVERQFGKGSIMRLGNDESTARDISVIPTGSVGLDIALGVGGVPRGRIVEIYGPESSGKTTLCLHIVAEAQKRGGVCGYIDAEHAMDVGYARKLGVRTDDLLLSQPDIHVRTQGSYLLAFDRRWLNMTLVERRLAVMGQFVDQIPGFVWDDHGAGSHEGSTR